MQPILSVDGLRKRFGSATAVDGVSFSVHSGEIYGLIGPDGAGKTTTMRALCGLILPDAGSIRALGYAIPGDERHMRARLGYMPQQYSLYGDLSVQENLRFFAGMYGVKGADLIAREERLLGIARLLEFRERPAGALSGGMYKKLALACALMHRPSLLLLDEPTNGVDPISRRELWTFLRELLDEGVAVVVSMPYMDEAECCHRVGLLVTGKLVAEGTPQELMSGFVHTVFEVRAAQSLSPRLFVGQPGVVSVYTVGKKLHVVTDEKASWGTHLQTVAQAAGLNEVTVNTVAPSFEDVFLSLTAAHELGDAT